MQAQVYEYEIPHVELGRPATVTIPSLPDRQFTGKVVFIQPTVDEVTRTVQVRIELPNREGIFKPGMFAQISIAHPMGEGLLVPTSAVLRTGDRDIVYRVEPGDHFVPVAVKISPIQFGDRYQVLEGLKEGEPIVTSANFLIDSESRIQFSRGDAGETHHVLAGKRARNSCLWNAGVRACSGRMRLDACTTISTTMIDRIIEFSARNKYLVIICHRGGHRRRGSLDAASAAGRHSRPLRHAGHHLFALGPKPRHRRGPSHLSDRDGDAGGAARSRPSAAFPTSAIPTST